MPNLMIYLIKIFYGKNVFRMDPFYSSVLDLYCTLNEKPLHLLISAIVPVFRM